MKVGEELSWRYIPRGGHAQFIDGVVTRLGTKLVEIGIKRESGEVIYRWVRPEHLHPAKSA